MSHSRYSEMEMQQWHDCLMTNNLDSANSDNNAPRHDGARASMAKGQAEKKESRSTAATRQTQTPKHDDWASECMFDWYNS